MVGGQVTWTGKWLLLSFRPALPFRPKRVRPRFQPVLSLFFSKLVCHLAVAGGSRRPPDNRLAMMGDELKRSHGYLVHGGPKHNKLAVTAKTCRQMP